MKGWFSGEVTGTILRFAGGIFSLLLLMGCQSQSQTSGDGAVNRHHVILIGASVGKDWDLAGLPARTGARGATFETVTLYRYDKGEAVKDVLLRPMRPFRPTRSYLRGFFQPTPKVPEIVILKECAAYFPGDLPTYQTMLEKWVRQLDERKIKVAVATVVPVTREHAAAKPGRIETIRAFNDWVRDYASRTNHALLDLEAVLREGEQERFLKAEYTSGDGLHLNRAAYDLLDRRLLEVLDSEQRAGSGQR